MSVLSDHHNFHLVYGNRLDLLAVELAAKLKEPGTGIFNPELIVVQGGGMARWLSLQLAENNGIAANFQCPFPKAFIEKYLFSPLLDCNRLTPLPSPELMTWRIFDLLPELSEKAEFSLIEKYLKDDTDGLKQIQIAERLALLLDNYTVFRPQMILDWSRGINPLRGCKESEWQQMLWNELACKGTTNFAELYSTLLRQIYPEFFPAMPGSDFTADFSLLAEQKRVFFFGFTTLPPSYLEIIYAASRICEVYFYYLTPCQEQHWVEVKDKKTATRERLKELQKHFAAKAENAGTDSEDVPEIELEEIDAGENINGLLRALGTQNRDFFRLICSLDEVQDTTAFTANKPVSLLKKIQQDIQEGRAPVAGNGYLEIEANDYSLQIHSCHGVMREVEVLFEQLLACFERDSTLLPHEVLVLVPDMEQYAPYLEAVFKSLPAESERWFFSTISDRRQRFGAEATALIDIFKLCGSRFTAPEVVTILETPAVSARFGIDDDRLSLLRRWIGGTNICWGIDGKFREDKIGVDFAANSWRTGLASLQAGFAFGSFPGSDEQIFSGEASGDLCPSDLVSEQNAELLGRFNEFMEQLFSLCRRMKDAETASAGAPGWWQDVAMEVIHTFFSDEGIFSAAVQGLRNTVCKMTGDIVRIAPKTKISRTVFEYILCRQFDGAYSAGGFLRGGVTFCEAKPLRSIPARVICMLGLNEGSFPRQQRKISFDLMAERPKGGDRSVRTDDRALFLECMISAKDCFYLSYIGQDSKDNSALPSSIVISELLDYLENGKYRLKSGGDSLCKHLVVRHPLQPFSRKYFDGNDARLFSYSTDNLHLANLIQQRGSGKAERNFCVTPLPEIQGELKELNLSDLIYFFRNPSKHFLTRRLQIDPGIRVQAEIAEAEKFNLDALDRYNVGEMLLEKKIESHFKSRPELFTNTCRRLECSGVLAPVKTGELQLKAIIETVSDQSSSIIANAAGEKIMVEEIFEFEHGITLRVRLDNLFINNGKITQILYRYTDMKDKDMVMLTISHLAANLLDRGPVRTVFVAKSKSKELLPVTAEEAKLQLQKLLNYYLTGMSKPLPFFISCSTVFCKALADEKTEEEALFAASIDWENNFDAAAKGDGSDEYIQFCFGPEFPGGDEFVKVSKAVVNLLGLA